jgi:hypothetical protein
MTTTAPASSYHQARNRKTKVKSSKTSSRETKWRGREDWNTNHTVDESIREDEPPMVLHRQSHDGHRPSIPSNRAVAPPSESLSHIKPGGRVDPLDLVDAGAQYSPTNSTARRRSFPPILSLPKEKIFWWIRVR